MYKYIRSASRIDIIRRNKAAYQAYTERLSTMSGLSQLVGQHLILPWIKGRDWLGGISDTQFQRGYEKIAKQGYTFDEVYDEFNRQMMEVPE